MYRIRKFYASAMRDARVILAWLKKTKGVHDVTGHMHKMQLKIIKIPIPLLHLHLHINFSSSCHFIAIAKACTVRRASINFIFAQ